LIIDTSGSNGAHAWHVNGVAPANDADAILRFDRLELKFEIESAARARLARTLLGRLAPDPYGDAEGHYQVATVYYDSPEHHAYWDRARGIAPRHKLRIRCYGPTVPETAATFFEIKTGLSSRVIKRRIALSFEAALALGRGEHPAGVFTALDELLIADLQRLIADYQMGPSALVRYRRQALAGPGDLRVTFDDRLAFRIDNLEDLADLRSEPLLEADRHLMEVKVPEVVPYWLTMLVAEGGGTMRSFSKYCRAVEVAGMLSGPAPAYAHAGL
jgi:hypothetical protein